MRQPCISAYSTEPGALPQIRKAYWRISRKPSSCTTCWSPWLTNTRRLSIIGWCSLWTALTVLMSITTCSNTVSSHSNVVWVVKWPEKVNNLVVVTKVFENNVLESWARQCALHDESSICKPLTPCTKSRFTVEFVWLSSSSDYLSYMTGSHQNCSDGTLFDSSPFDEFE